MSLFNVGLTLLAIIGGVASIIQIRIWILNWQDSRIDKFASVERHGLKLLEQVEADDFQPDFVLGIGRGGAFLAGWIAGNLGSVCIEVIDRRHQEQSTEPVDFPYLEEKIALLRKIHGEGAKVLVVEAAATRGNTFISFERARLRLAPDWVCRYAVLYEVDTNIARIDFLGRRLARTPPRYPWHNRVGYRRYLRRPDRERLAP